MKMKEKKLVSFLKRSMAFQMQLALLTVPRHIFTKDQV